MNKILLLFLLVAILSGCQFNRQRKEIELKEKGVIITDKLFKTLAGELNGKIQQEGVAAAIGYCSLNALGITEKVGNESDVELFRVTHRARNPLNKADETELKMIENYILQQSQGSILHPQIVERDGKKVFYSPILLSAPLCLSCHGNPANMESAVVEAIQSRYPEDKAVSFELNEVRGMFKVVFN